MLRVRRAAKDRPVPHKRSTERSLIVLTDFQNIPVPSLGFGDGRVQARVAEMSLMASTVLSDRSSLTRSCTGAGEIRGSLF